MSGGARLCVSIVNYRTPGHCIGCLESLLAERADFPGFHVVVADGASGDESLAILADWIERGGHGDWVALLPLDRNGGFGWAHNQVMLRALQGETPPDYIYLLNPDAVVRGGTLRALVTEMDADPRRAVTGGVMDSPGGTVQLSAHHFPDWRMELATGARTPGLLRLLGRTHAPQARAGRSVEVDWVSGSNFCVRAEAIRACGLFDDGFFLYFEEIEWQWRLRRGGWTVWQSANASILHEGGAATKVSRDPAVRARTPLPAYWYRSQRRYFMLTRGRAAASAIFTLWLVARVTLGAARRLASPRVRATGVYRETADKLRCWREPARPAATPAVALWTDPPGRPPAWESAS